MTLYDQVKDALGSRWAVIQGPIFDETNIVSATSTAVHQINIQFMQTSSQGYITVAVFCDMRTAGATIRDNVQEAAIAAKDIITRNIF